MDSLISIHLEQCGRYVFHWFRKMCWTHKPQKEDIEWSLPGSLVRLWKIIFLPKVTLHPREAEKHAVKIPDAWLPEFNARPPPTSCKTLEKPFLSTPQFLLKNGKIVLPFRFGWQLMHHHDHLINISGSHSARL